MAAPLKYYYEIRVKLKKVETLELLKKVYETQKYKTATAIINAALEKGLPLLLSGEERSVNPDQLANKVAEQVLEKFTPISNSLLFNMRKIAVLQTVQESMLGSLLQEFEFFLKTKGVSIDPAILEEFRIALPDRFENDKQDLIERLFDAADATEEGDTDE